jgi:aspartyl-tRNA(Asn)/glutamyl-tRNA(Gln) amidotransferase subunit C
LGKSGKIDRATMEHICLLAKLNLTEAEKESYARELSDVLDAFRVLDSIDAKDDPAFHPIEIRDRLREDEVRPTRWNPLGNAKALDGRYFRGPKIV